VSLRLNISIDDVSPHLLSSTEVLDRCHSLIKVYPDIKFTLFVPIAYWRTMRAEAKTQEPLHINRFPDFCRTMRSLSPRNFEICYHGLYHGIPHRSDNDEFQELSYANAMEKFAMMDDIVKKAGMEEHFVKVFRPPAWRMSPGAFDAARDSKYEMLALSPKDYAQKTYCGKDKSEDWKGKVVYYDCNPPFDELVDHKQNEIVYHACQWDKNYLNENLTGSLNEFLRGKNIQFNFIRELAV